MSVIWFNYMAGGEMWQNTFSDNWHSCRLWLCSQISQTVSIGYTVNTVWLLGDTQSGISLLPAGLGQINCDDYTSVSLSKVQSTPHGELPVTSQAGPRPEPLTKSWACVCHTHGTECAGSTANTSPGCSQSGLSTPKLPDWFRQPLAGSDASVQWKIWLHITSPVCSRRHEMPHYLDFDCYLSHCNDCICLNLYD